MLRRDARQKVEPVRIDWNKRARRYAGRLVRLFSEDDPLLRELAELVKHGDEIHVRWQNDILLLLEKLSGRIETLVAGLRGVSTRQPEHRR